MFCRNIPFLRRASLCALLLTTLPSCGGAPDVSGADCAPLVMTESEPRPALGERGAEPEPGSACMTRVSDYIGHNEPVAVHIGSRHQAWNADETLVLLRRGQLLRPSDRAIVGTVPAVEGIWVWSPRDRARLYGVKGARIVAYNVETQTTTDVLTMDDTYARIVTETELGEPTADERAFTVVAERTSAAGGGKYLVQIDLVSARVLSAAPLPIDDVGRHPHPRWVTALPGGNGSVAGWPSRAGEWQRSYGVELYDGAGRFVRRLTDNLVPGDVAWDAGRVPWFVHVDSSASAPRILKTRLDRKEPAVALTTLPSAPQAQVSCLARGRDFCAVATTPLTGADQGNGEVMLVALVPGTPVRHLAAHGSLPEAVYREDAPSCALAPSAMLPSPSLDRRGSRVLFGSNWGAHCFAELYKLDLEPDSKDSQ